MKALTLHQAAVLPTASAHTINLDDQFESDIAEKIPVVEGFSPVPEGPGLGVEVDEEALAQAAARAHLPRYDYIGVVHFAGGHKAYSLGSPNINRLTGTEEAASRASTLSTGPTTAQPNTPASSRGYRRKGRLSRGRNAQPSE